MFTKPIASYTIIKPYFDKVRLFSQNHLFLIFSTKVGFHILTRHKNIPTYHLTSTLINHGIFTSQGSSFSQNFQSSSVFHYISKSIHFQNKTMLNHS